MRNSNDVQEAGELRLVQFGIRLDFAEEGRIYSIGQKVSEAITGEIPSKHEPKYEENFRLRSSKRKVAIAWNPLWCAVTSEDVSNLDKCIEIILTTLEQIRAAAPIYKLNERRVTTYWILPAPNYDFPSLERRYREKMLAQNEISSLAADSSAVFDIRIGELTLHHQSGAMLPQQLSSDYLQFKLDDMPEAFLFLEASIADKKVVEYSSEDIRNDLVASLDYCKSHSDAFHRIWEGIL